jgi:hypothetical protein
MHAEPAPPSGEGMALGPAMLDSFLSVLLPIARGIGASTTSGGNAPEAAVSRSVRIAVAADLSTLAEHRTLSAAENRTAQHET